MAVCADKSLNHTIKLGETSRNHNICQFKLVSENKKTTNVFACYARTDSHMDENVKFYQYLTHKLKDIGNLRNTLIIGDLNARLAETGDHGKNGNTYLLERFLIEHGLSVANSLWEYDNPTYTRDGKSSTIDYAIGGGISEQAQYFNVNSDPIFDGDHKPIK